MSMTILGPGWRLASLLAACIVVGCGGDEGNNEAEILALEVTGSLPDITFAWDGPGVTLVDVRDCDAGCTGLRCVDGEYLSKDPDCKSTDCSPRTRWYVDFFETGKEFSSPIIYGMLGAEPDPSAQPLTPGVLHGVQLRRDGPCDPPEEGCGQTVATGCALFTP